MKNPSQNRNLIENSFFHNTVFPKLNSTENADVLIGEIIEHISKYWLV